MKLPHRKHGKFQRVPFGEIGLFEQGWLQPIDSVKKIVFDEMLRALATGKWDLWRLEDGPMGVAVTYPYKGQLFIYYLRGHGLFDKLTMEDLQDAAEGEGLNGVIAEVASGGMKKILQRLGFVAVGQGPGGWTMELSNGRV